MSPKGYPNDLKVKIVNLYKSGKTPKELATEYGISPAVIYKWNKELNNENPPKTKISIQTQLIELRKENQQLKMENDLLKQIAKFMEPKKSKNK